LRPARSFAAELVRNLVRGLIILFGLVMALKAPTYRKRDFYAGGVTLIFLGVLIAGTELGVPPGENKDILPAHP